MADTAAVVVEGAYTAAAGAVAGGMAAATVVVGMHAVPGEDKIVGSGSLRMGVAIAEEADDCRYGIPAVVATVGVAADAKE